MTAKETLLERAREWTDEQAQIALRAVEESDPPASQMAALPQGLGETLTGEPMPDVVTAVRRSRAAH